MFGLGKHRLRCIATGLSVLFISLGQALAVNAQTPVVYTDDGRNVFRVMVPDFWSLRSGGLRNISDPELGELRDVSRVFGLTPDGHEGVWVGLISPHGVRDLDGAVDYLSEIGPFLVQDATVNAPNERRVSGYPARTITGQGSRNGKSLSFTVVTVDIPGDRVVIAVVIFEAGADLDPLGDINKMLSTIRAM